MLMLLVQGPAFENQCFLQRKNALGFPRCLGMNEGAHRDLFLATTPKLSFSTKYVLSSHNTSNTMLGIKVNIVRETDIGALCSGM